MLTKDQFRELCRQAEWDPRPFIETCCWITTKNLPGQPPIARLVFNGTQRRIHEKIMAQREAKLPPRAIILKCRQPGASTLVAGYATASLVCRPYADSMVIAHREDAAIGLFNKVDFMVDRLPEGVRPIKTRDKKDEIGFLHLECRDGLYELGTHYASKTAKSPEAGRSPTLQLVHCSEFAFWPYPEQTLNAVLQSVPKTPESLVVIESTANGFDNAFYVEWQRAMSGDSGFVPIFVPWHEIPEYAMRVPSDFDLTAEERELKRAFGLTGEQLQWRRYAIHTDCQGEEELFNQEYPATVNDAFMATGQAALNRKALQEQYSYAQDAPRKVGFFLIEQQGFMEMSRGPLTVYKFPTEGHEYAIGGDPSAGQEGGDPGCIQVIDRTTCEQVAVWQGWLDPVSFADLMMALGTWYKSLQGPAWIAPELNAGYGISAVEQMKLQQYGRIYVWQRPDRVRGGTRNWYGWQTTQVTRPLLIDTFNFALKDRDIKIWDQPTITECIRLAAHTGGRVRDDRAMALLIAYRVHIEMPMERTGLPPRVAWADAVAIVPGTPEWPANLTPFHAEIWKEVTEAEQQMAVSGGRSPIQEFSTPEKYQEGEEEDFTPEIPW